MDGVVITHDLSLHYTTSTKVYTLNFRGFKLIKSIPDFTLGYSTLSFYSPMYGYLELCLAHIQGALPAYATLVAMRPL